MPVNGLGDGIDVRELLLDSLPRLSGDGDPRLILRVASLPIAFWKSGLAEGEYPIAAPDARGEPVPEKGDPDWLLLVLRGVPDLE